MVAKYIILIAEDRSEDRLLIRKILENMGHDVLEATNGQKGLELARLHKPYLIISDVLMPQMDGFHFLRNLKRDKETKNIPFIFYSAVYTGNKDEKLALSLGARAFIEKPVEPDLFIKKLESIIEGIKVKKGSEQVELIEEEEEYLKKYSDIVATKLEEKVIELEKTNVSLQLEIAKRLKAEEELKKHKEHLEEVVKKRTMELEEKNNELEKYNKMFVNREFRIKELRDRIKELE